MNKPYLLIAGENFYPSDGTGDWVGCFSTYEEAIVTGKQIGRAHV